MVTLPWLESQIMKQTDLQGNINTYLQDMRYGRVHSILANWMILLHFGRVSWTQWIQRCAHFLCPFGSYCFHQCSGESMAGGHTSACMLHSDLLAGHQNQGQKYTTEPGLRV